MDSTAENSERSNKPDCDEMFAIEHSWLIMVFKKVISSSLKNVSTKDCVLSLKYSILVNLIVVSEMIPN
jgi:hypothetical protein